MKKIPSHRMRGIKMMNEVRNEHIARREYQQVRGHLQKKQR